MLRRVMTDHFANSGTIQVVKALWLEDVPSYANKIFYSLGFLSMICFVLLFATGIILVFLGPDWWLATKSGIFIRSMHMWAVQAFVLFIILHGLIVLLTGGYRAPRRFLWILGVVMFFLALFEAEFGYVLRSDFSSQWRSLQGADFYNGSGLGVLINNLNYAQIYGIHVIIIPIVILGILGLHYALVRLRGIATPYKKDVPVTIVKANHTILFLRGSVLIVVIVLLSIVFPSPMISPLTIEQVATDDPNLMATTLIGEIDKSSDTATYSDNIDPYKYDTKQMYIDVPYAKNAVAYPGSPNMLNVFNAEDKATQEKNLKEAKDYFDNKGSLTTTVNPKNPVIPMISTLVLMGQSGMYEAMLRSFPTGGTADPTFATRFLADTGIPEENADKLGITTPKYGMLREEKGFAPGAWWLSPLGFLDNTVLKNDDNQDRDGAELLGLSMLFLMAFPYIPYLNRLPGALGVGKFIWKE